MRATHSRPVQIRQKLRNFDLTICDLAAMAASLYVPCARAKHSGESSCYRRDTRPLSVFRGIEKWKITPATLSFSFIFSWSSMLGLHSPGDIHLVEKKRTFWKKKKFVRSDDYKKKTCGKRALWFLRSILLYFYVLLISFRAHTFYLWSTINSPFLSLFRLAL